MARGPLSRDQLERFFEVGFLVVEGLFDDAEVARMAASFDRLAAMASGLTCSGEHLGSEFVIDPSTPGAPVRIHRVVWCGAAESDLLSLGGDPRLVALAAQILGTSRVQQLINQAHFKMPGDEVAFPWHQDSTHRRFGTPVWRDVNGRGSFVEIATAVDPMGPENGGLAFIPGSGLVGHIEVDAATGELPGDSFDPAAAVRPELAPGSAVLFGPYTVHGSGANRSSRSRRVFLNGFACPGANDRIYPGRGSGRMLVSRSRS